MEELTPYHSISIKTYMDFVRASDTINVGQMTRDELKLIYLSNALGGEVGELQNVVKKITAIPGGFVNDHALMDEFVKEAGDVLWYLFRIIGHAGYTVEYVMHRNEYKLHERENEKVPTNPTPATES